MNASNQIAIRHFGSRVIKKLLKKGISVMGLQAIPGLSGTFLDCQTAYRICDNGKARVMRLAEVLQLVA